MASASSRRCTACSSCSRPASKPTRVAAFIVEPVQGEGGFRPAPEAFMRGLRELADAHGILLIADEIQTGFARTGRLFATQHHDVPVDLICFAKSLAGGLPLSGVCGRSVLMDAAEPGGLGGTYAGNPLAVAAAHAVLDVIADEALCERAERLGQRLRAQLSFTAGPGAAAGRGARPGQHAGGRVPLAGQRRARRRLHPPRAGGGAAAGPDPAELRQLRQCDPLPAPADHAGRGLRRGDGHPGRGHDRGMKAQRSPSLALLREAALLDGRWVQADDGRCFDVHDPATTERLGSVPLLGAAETRRAIEAAARAWPAWRRRSARDRGQLLRQLGALMLARSEDLATLITREQGKPLAEARGEVAYAAAYLDWYAEEGKRVYGETIPAPSGDRRLLVFREPIGVCAAITPWNFPLAMMARKLAPALAAGNPIIVKPAESTPFSALALGLLAEEVGLPAGLLQVLTGEPRAIGAELCASATVRKLSFTGSTAVGRLLFAQSAATIKKLSLELGGLAPFIVFDDADLDAAVEGALLSKYRNTGQTCVCSNRFLVQAGVYEDFAERLRRASEALVVGNGLHSGVQQGPLINAAALAKVQHQVDDALARGARLLTGGQRHALGGNFYPTHGAGRCAPRHAGGARGNLRPGGAAAALCHRGGGDRAGQ